MTNEWIPINFEISPYKSSGTYIVKIVEEVSQLLDDHIVMTQSMSFSPYKKAFEERISKWESQLRTTQVIGDIELSATLYLYDGHVSLHK
jgi:dynein heavy chain, axonemal